MPLPTKQNIVDYSYSLDGSPWVNVGTSLNMQIPTYNYSLDGSPWSGVSDPIAPLEMDLGMFKIYNRVLSDEEVTQNYLAFKGRYNL